MLTQNSQTIVKAENYELFKNGSEIRAIRKNDLFITNDLSERKDVTEFLKYKEEYSENEVNELFNQLSYFEN